MTAASASGMPGIRHEGKSRCLKGSLVDLASDLTHHRFIVVIQGQLVPGFLQRTGFQLNLQTLCVASLHLRLEHPSTIGDDPQERRLETLKIIGCKLRELFADLLAASINGAFQDPGRILLAKLLA